MTALVIGIGAVAGFVWAALVPDSRPYRRPDEDGYS